jgi:flagella basal body P-ring formation protein FlgA
MLRWDQGGIRVVLPVTCLDGGGLGEHVRARLKSAARILPAEVLQDGTLRASL